MTHRRFGAATLRTALGAAAVTGCMLIPAAAQATPLQNTTCRGGLTKDAKPTKNDPNLLDYSFHCSSDITGYTIIVNRGINDFGTIDDFNVAPSIYDVHNSETPYAIDPTESIDCEAQTTPGNGINCFAIGLPKNPQIVAAYNFIDGTFDTSAPFCGSTSKSGKVTPAAFAQLIVTDTTGAEWGPFTLPLAKGCPKASKPAKSTKPKTKKPGSKKKSTKPKSKKTIAA